MQRGLELAVGDRQVLGRVVRGVGAVEQRGELVVGRARVVARRAQLVEAALDLRHRARVVVQVVAERVLDLEPRLERQPAAAQVHELAQHVEVVREADRVLVDVVAPFERLMACWPCEHLLLSLVVLGEEPALVAPDHAGQQSAAGAHVDDGPVRDTGDRAGVTASDAEGVDVEALEAHLDVPVLDRREHLLRHRDVLLHDEVRALGVRGDDPLPLVLGGLHAERDAVAAVVGGRLEHQPLAVVGDERAAGRSSSSRRSTRPGRRMRVHGIVCADRRRPRRGSIRCAKRGSWSSANSFLLLATRARNGLTMQTRPSRAAATRSDWSRSSSSARR